MNYVNGLCLCVRLPILEANRYVDKNPSRRQIEPTVVAKRLKTTARLFLHSFQAVWKVPSLNEQKKII
jgi:hypothetical protein